MWSSDAESWRQLSGWRVPSERIGNFEASLRQEHEREFGVCVVSSKDAEGTRECMIALEKKDLQFRKRARAVENDQYLDSFEVRCLLRRAVGEGRFLR